MILRLLLTWLLFIPVAILNGVVRERLYKQIVGELAAHQMSTLILSIAFIIFARYMITDILLSANTGVVIMIGFVWVILTVIFEFGFGRYVDQETWDRLLANYNIFKGRIWSLFLLVELLTPFIIKLLNK